MLFVTRCGICCVPIIFERQCSRMGSKISGYRHAARLARDGTIDRPATDVVAPDQLPMLEALQTRLEGKTAKQKNPHPKFSIAWLSWIIARLGGWTGYASERPPGPITMRRGWHRFEHMVEGWRLRNVCTP